MSISRVLKDVLKRLPGARVVKRVLFQERRPNAGQVEGHAEVFARICRTNAWKGRESVSGSGSDLDQTRELIRQMPALLRELNATSMLDIPCGDFNWMKRVDLGGISYTGADIVPDLIETNQRRYGADRIRFVVADLLRGGVPRADVVLCRDCLVHFSFQDVFAALETICASGARYLLTTTFTAHPSNTDIRTGGWRPLNLEKEPFLLPGPERLLVERCTENGGVYADKSLGLWQISSVLRRLEPALDNNVNIVNV